MWRNDRIQMIARDCAINSGAGGVGIDDRRAETLHHLEGVIRERDRLFVARDAASEIIVIEKAHVAADAFASKRAALKERRVIGLRRLHDTEKDGDIGDGPRHRTGAVLLMTDWNNSVLRNQTERRFQTENVLDRRRTRD